MTRSHKFLSIADGHYQDSVDSASSLVSIIDEIRNNSLCNLLYMTNSSADIHATCDKEKPEPVKPSSPVKNVPVSQTVVQPVNATTVVHNRDGSVKSVKSSGLSPAKNRETAESGLSVVVRKTPPLYTAVGAKNSETAKPSCKLTSPIKNRECPFPGNRKTSPLYTSVGSRKNLLELAGISAESAILNTPKKIAAEKIGKFSVVQPTQLTPNETRKSGYYQPEVRQQPEVRHQPEPVEFDSRHPQSAEFQSRLVRPKPVNFLDYSATSRPKPFFDLPSDFESPSSSYRPNALSHFPALSPSAKYTSDNTPTPPLRSNQVSLLSQ
jgi:hypothetical protein